MEDARRRVSPAVSVIVVNFNGGHLVPMAVDGVLASEVPVNVIIADNGSTDRCFSLQDR